MRRYGPVRTATAAPNLAKVSTLQRSESWRSPLAGVPEFSILNFQFSTLIMNSSLKSAMKQGYWDLWNDKIQSQIDNDIEANRKADYSCDIDLPEGTEVRAEQISHDFIFGAHLFNFNQLGTDERNEKYKALYGTLFNSATIPFYWQPFEPRPGEMRFETADIDTAEFWNNCEDPKNQFHWRRPSTDQLVDFCEEKGIRCHGHPLVWGNQTWHYPHWIWDQMPKEYIIHFLTDTRCGTNILNKSPDEIDKLLPGFIDYYNAAIDRRIKAIAERYGTRIQSYDICNESATDFQLGKMIPEDRLCKSTYGFMPGDYTYHAFKTAMKYLPESTMFNINDYNMSEAYRKQTEDLIGRGCRIDIQGAQMHLFNPQSCLDIANGEPNAAQQPLDVMATMKRICAGRPIHLSEITITAPNNDERGQAIQAVITHNLYRLWFSIKPMMGITWWNVVDDCGAPGEPSVSGLFSRDMEPKPAYFAMNDLINKEWKTNLELKADKDGKIEFRGFRGKYRLTWTDADGKLNEKIVEVK